MMENTKRDRVVIWAATLNGTENAAEETRLREWVEARGWTVSTVLSGHATREDEAWSELRQLVESGEVDAVVSGSLWQLFPTYRELVRCWPAWNASGVVVATLDDRGDMSHPMQRVGWSGPLRALGGYDHQRRSAVGNGRRWSRSGRVVAAVDPRAVARLYYRPIGLKKMAKELGVSYRALYGAVSGMLERGELDKARRDFVMGVGSA